MTSFAAVDPPDAPVPEGGYTQAMSVEGATRLLFVSGQVPETRDGEVPEQFEAQCRLVWDNILAALREAGLGVRHLVKVTTFLSDRRYAAANGEVRRQVLGDHRPALTVVVAGIFDSRWLLEIEAVAAA